MIWSVIASVYITAGGSLALLLVGGEDRASQLVSPLRPAPAFALVVGTIVLWPVLLALAIDQQSSR